MFFRMALLLCLLLLFGISAATPITDASDSSQPDQDLSDLVTGSSLDTDTTTRRSSSSLDQDPLNQAALAQYLGKGDIYDQRQEGELNVHVRVDNASLYFVLLDGLGELVWRKGHKGSVKNHYAKHAATSRRATATDRTTAIDASSAAAATPNAVSASPPAAVSASTPSNSDSTTDTKPPRSTYKPPGETKPEQMHSTTIEIVSAQPTISYSTGSTTEVQSEPSQEPQKPSLNTKQKQDIRPVATAKSHARSEEQISILNLLKRTAALTAQSGASLRRHHSHNNGHHSQQR